MKKSYHSTVVPIALATATRRASPEGRGFTPTLSCASRNSDALCTPLRVYLFRATLSSSSRRRPFRRPCPSVRTFLRHSDRTRDATAHGDAPHFNGDHDESNEDRRQRCDFGDWAGG